MLFEVALKHPMAFPGTDDPQLVYDSPGDDVAGLMACVRREVLNKQADGDRVNAHATARSRSRSRSRSGN